MKSQAAVHRAERLTKEPHSLEAVFALVNDLAALCIVPKSLQVYLDTVRAWARSEQHRLALENTGLVGKAVTRTFAVALKVNKVEEEDAIQEGIMALMHAALLFDRKFKLQFCTYATWWINQYLQRMILHGGLIRIPTHIGEKLRHPELHKDDSYCQDALLVKRVAALMDVFPDDGDNNMVGEALVPDEKHPLRIDAINARFDVQELLKCLVDKRDRFIIECVYFRDLTLDATGRLLAENGFNATTRERVRQLRDKALKRMRWWAGELKKRAKS